MNVLTNRVSAQLGLWAAILSAATFLIYTIAFFALVRADPLPDWTNLPDFVAAARVADLSWLYVAQFSMLLFAPFFVVLLHSIHEWAPPAKQPLSRIGLSFGLIFAAFFSMHYFVQLTTVRLGIASGATGGLEQFIQLRPHAAITAINMLGSSLFLGLASLFMAGVFGRSRLERVIRLTFAANGVVCLAAAGAYLLDHVLLIMLLTTFALGGLLITLFVALAFFFRNQHKRIA